LIWSNFPLFSFLRQKQKNAFLNDFFFSLFFYATDIFWSGNKQNNYLFFDMLQNQEMKKLDTKEFLRKQQETKISEGYNLINGAKL
jgi:hypothetical protein